MTMLQLYEDFGLDENTQSFTGHAMALQRDDSYLHKYVLVFSGRPHLSFHFPVCHHIVMGQTLWDFGFFLAVCFGFVLPSTGEA